MGSRVEVNASPLARGYCKFLKSNMGSRVDGNARMLVWGYLNQR